MASQPVAASTDLGCESAACGMATPDDSALQLDAFPIFTPLLEACLSYAELSGCRFQRGAFYDLDNELSEALEAGQESALPPLLHAKMCASPVVESFTRRLRQGEAALLEAAANANHLVMAEGVRSGIIATCQELRLWPPSESAGVEDDDCRFEDTSAPLPAIARRAYNDEVRREAQGLAVTLRRRAITASFLMDFVLDAGLKLPMPESQRAMLQEFMDRVTEWTGTTADTEASQAQQKAARRALLNGLGFGANLEAARQQVQVRWAKNWETRSGAALNVATMALAMTAGYVSFRRAVSKR